MYERFFGFRAKPFELRPDPAFMYSSERHMTALSLLEYGLFHHDGFSIITGEVGSGKTTVVRYLLERLNGQVTVGLISNTHQAFGNLLQCLSLAFGLDYRHKAGIELYDTFATFVHSEYRRGKRVLLIVDEAQNLGPQTLEALRVLSNINADDQQVLHTALVGQPELRATLGRSDLLQFRQRIAVSFHLSPLTETETHGYMAHRMEVAGGRSEIFEAACAPMVYQYSGGIPRLINVICDTALVYAYGERSRRVGAQTIQRVIDDRRASGLLPIVEQPPASMVHSA